MSSSTGIVADLLAPTPESAARPSQSSRSTPPTSRRGVTALVEILLFGFVTMVVAIVEYYLERIVPDDNDGFLAKIFAPIDTALHGVAQMLYRIERSWHELVGNDEAAVETIVDGAYALLGTRDGAPVGDFALSNWVIGFLVMAIWTVATARRSTTPAGGLTQMSYADDRGGRAGFARTMLRTAIRAVVIYGLPLMFFNKNQLLWIGMFVGAGVILSRMPLRRSPWDLIAGTTPVESFGLDAPAEFTHPKSAADLRVDGMRQTQNQRARRILQGAGWGAIIVSLLIVWVVFSEAWAFVSAEDFSWGLLNIGGERRGWFPRRDLYDLSTLFVGTLWVTGIAMLVAGPVGLAVAIYLSEYAKPRIQRIVKPIIETLASVPSVVIGMFAIFFVSPTLLRSMFGDIGIFSILSAGIGVGILTIPLVASISEDALRAVPNELREAAYGLGSRKITVALRVVFPAALSGISAAFIVGISRAIGETMVVAIAAGGSGGTLFELDPTEPGQTITAAMASLGAGTDQVAGSGIAFQSLYFLGALLFLLTLLLNVFSDAIVRRFREAY